MQEILKQQYESNPDFWFKVIGELSGLLDSGMSENELIGDFLNTLRNIENELEIEMPLR